MSADPRTEELLARLRTEVSSPNGTGGEFEHTWGERPLEEVVKGLLAGTLTQPMPDIGRLVDDERGLFYAGCVNGIHGEPTACKTWLGLLVSLQEIRRQRHVHWIDFEDNEVTIVGRLLELGAEPDLVLALFHYHRPEEAIGFEATEYLVGTVRENRASLVVVDSVGEAMAVQGTKPNDDDSVARWFRILPRKLADAGACFVGPDHVVKDKDGRGRWAIGSQRKGAAITGASYGMTVFAEPAKGALGKVKLVVAKDRHGTRKRGSTAGELVLDGTREQLHAELVVPASQTNADGEFMPTHLMEKVSRWVELNPGVSQNQIRKEVDGKDEYVIKAIGQLVAGGFFVVEEGPRKARLHRSAMPYREDGDERAF